MTSRKTEAGKRFAFSAPHAFAGEALLVKPSLVMRSKVARIYPPALVSQNRRGSMNEFILFFAYGLVEDVLAATYNKFVQKNWTWLAGLSAFSIFAFGVYCLSLILYEFSFEHARFWGFGLGNAIGTMCVVEYFKWEQKRSHERRVRRKKLGQPRNH